MAGKNGRGPRLTMDRSARQRRDNKRTGLFVAGLVAGMIALSFASVPLYRLFCQVTGFGGTTQVAQKAPETAGNRIVAVRFNADISSDLPWRFKPDQNIVKVKVGQQAVISYTAENLSRQPVTGSAIYNVVPEKAGKYFKKIQCFCFQEQSLEAGQKVNMPVMFFIDPAFSDDKNMEDVGAITLSYTFYPLNTPALEWALEAFYNPPAAVEASVSNQEN